MRIVPHSASDITVVDRSFNPAVLSVPISVSNGTATFSVANLGLYLVMIDDGLYMEVGKFDIEPSAPVNSPYHELYGLKKGMAFTLADPQFSPDIPHPFVTNAYKDADGNLIFQRTDGFNINVGQVTGTVSGNTLAIGTVTTGAAGSAAAASITGTAPNQTINLTIPRGDTGAQGVQGIQGIQGIQGPAGRNPITVSTTAPSSPVDGDIWFDIS
jgi:hypothetical protein